jgi:hypothetical protein
VRQVQGPVKAVLLAGVVLIVAGCDLMWALAAPPWAGPPWPDEPPFPEPTILATYETGSATLEITRAGEPVESVTFERVGAGSALDGLLGTSINWRNDDGWVLTLTAYDEYTGDVTLQWINGLEVWRTDPYGMGGNRCVVQLEESSPEMVQGTAKCYALRWTDGLAPPFPVEPAYIESEQPFDAEITFEAAP